MSASEVHGVREPRVDIVRDDGVAVVVLRGEIDLTVRHELQVALAEAVGADRVVVDLGAATFIDSTTINALLVARTAAELAGVALALTRGPRNVMRALELSGVVDVFEMVEARRGRSVPKRG